MGPQRRAIAVVALAGFLSCAAWSAGLMPSLCCSETCDPCPILLSKGTAVPASSKADTLLAPAPSSGYPFVLPPAGVPATIASQLPVFPSHGFRRPMRN